METSAGSVPTGATLPTVLPTAHALLHEIGRLRAGESVLVQGAAGGVGTVAGQLARTGRPGTPSGRAPPPIRRATGGRGVDLLLDSVGGDTLRRGVDALAVFGRLVSFGNASGAQPWSVGQSELHPGSRSVAGFSILEPAASDPATLRAVAERAFRAVTDGHVDLPVTAQFALEDAADAHLLMEGRTSTGKLVLRIGG